MDQHVQHDPGDREPLVLVRRRLRFLAVRQAAPGCPMEIASGGLTVSVTDSVSRTRGWRDAKVRLLD